MHSRRKFLTQAGVLAASSIGAPALPAESKASILSGSETVSLCGQWRFRTDSENIGEAQHWFGADESDSTWHKVLVPHTWQVESGFTDYRGVAWYLRTFDAPSEWQDSAVRLEFEAVFHTAKIWVNGQLAGEHVRKGYTAFVLDITHLLRLGKFQHHCSAR